MTTLTQSLETVLRQPDPAALAALQTALLAEAAPSCQRDRCLELAGQFHAYLVEMRTKLSARQYSELASWLDIAAVGLVAFEDLIRGTATSWRDLLVGLASEGLMALGSRQYIKAWSAELGPIHEAAAWTLREALWRLSEETQPDLEPAGRLAAVQGLLPNALGQAQSSAQAVVLGRLFQIVLLIRVTQLLPSQAPGQPAGSPAT